MEGSGGQGGLAAAGIVYELSIPHTVGSSSRAKVLDTLSSMDRVEVLQKQYGSGSPPSILIRSDQSKDRGLMQTIARAGRLDVDGFLLQPASYDPPPNGDVPPPPEPKPPYYKIAPAQRVTIGELEESIAREFSPNVIEKVGGGAVYVRSSVVSSVREINVLPFVQSATGTRNLPTEMNGGGGNGGGGNGGSGGRSGRIFAGVSNTTLAVGGGVAAAGILALVASS